MDGCKEVNNPLVSVIVLAYNAENSIDVTMEWLVNQQCDFDFEIVVGEDASHDGTRKLVVKWAEKYPEIVRLMPKSENKGLVKNYFDCLEACRGKYVTDCSAGDMFTATDRLQKLASLLEERPELVGVFTDVEGCEFTDKPTVENYLSSAGGGTMVLSAMMYKASALKDAIALNRELIANEKFGCEDLGVICALLAAGEVEKMEEKTFCYNREGASVSRPSAPEAEMRFHAATLYAILTLARSYDALTPRVVKKLRVKLNHLANIVFFRFDSGLYELWKDSYRMMKDMRGVKANLKNVFVSLTGMMRR